MNPRPKAAAVKAILQGTLIRFIFLMLAIFGIYAAVFAWAKLDPSKCSLVADREVSAGVWIAYCLPEE